MSSQTVPDDMKRGNLDSYFFDQEVHHLGSVLADRLNCTTSERVELSGQSWPVDGNDIHIFSIQVSYDNSVWYNSYLMKKTMILKMYLELYNLLKT